MLLAVLIFSLTGWNGQSVLLRVAIRLALLPVVAAVSYEMLMLLARFDNVFIRILSWPGKQLQRLTTHQPNDDMVRVAISSALAVMDDEWLEKAIPEGYEFPVEFAETEDEKIESEITEVAIDDDTTSN